MLSIHSFKHMNNDTCFIEYKWFNEEIRHTLNM